MSTTIRLPHTPDARHLFTGADGATYMVERSPSPGDRHEIDLPVEAPRGMRAEWQVMTEACRVALVGFRAPDGHPLTWTWLDADKAAEVTAARAN